LLYKGVKPKQYYFICFTHGETKILKGLSILCMSALYSEVKSHGVQADTGSATLEALQLHHCSVEASGS